MTALSRTLPRATIAFALAAGALSPSAGCSIIGAVAYKVSGPAAHPPEHALAKEPTMVLVERAGNPGETAVEAVQIAVAITEQLRASKTAPPLVDAGLALEARSRRTPDGRRPSPAEVARECGATQVIYVDLKQYASNKSLAGDAIDGNAEAAVWVFDARTAQARWPVQSNAGRGVSVAVPFTPVAGPGTAEAVRQQIAQELGTKVSRLFVGWTEE